jgi:hypothetical protein
MYDKIFMILMGVLWTYIGYNDTPESNLLKTLDLGIATMWLIASFFIDRKESK